mgnify:CR=1 FL=1
MSGDSKCWRPRGWPAGTTWDSAEGLANGPPAFIAEEFRPIGQRKFIKSKRIPGVLRHEIGHAYDHAINPLQDLSQSPEFLAAFRKDKAAMNSIVRGNLKYFIQRGDAGPSEAFAEGFAAIFGGGAAQGSRAELFKRSFPNVLKVIEEITSRERKS